MGYATALLIVGSQNQVLKTQRLVSANATTAAAPQPLASLGYLVHTIWPGLCAGLLAFQATKDLENQAEQWRGEIESWGNTTKTDKNPQEGNPKKDKLHVTHKCT